MRFFIGSLLLIVLLQSCTKSDTPAPDPTPQTPDPVDTLTAGWQLKKIESSGRVLADILFLNATLGFACGESSTVLKTTDGGVTWQQGSVPAGSTTYSNIQFVNSQYGFIAANAGVYRTTDGGNTWSQAYSSGFLTEDLFFISPATGFMTSVTGLRKTVDSGKTWTNATSVFTACSSLWFTSATKGFVTASSSGLFKTVDGGNTFSQAFAAATSSYLPVYFANATNGCTGFGPNLYITNDGGSNWSLLKQFDASIIDAKNLGSNEYYVCTRNEIWHTTDAGTTWVREVKLVSKTAIEFTLGQPGHVWVSADGGYVLYK